MGFQRPGGTLSGQGEGTHVHSVSIQACRDFLVLAQTHSKKWQKSLQYERDQRIRLEETLEQLAKQHNHLERAFRGATVLPAGAPGAGSSKGGGLGGPVGGLARRLAEPRVSAVSASPKMEFSPPCLLPLLLLSTCSCVWFVFGRPALPGLINVAK